VHELSAETTDDTHVFALSQVYEGSLLKMGEKGNDGGQFFAPREIIRAVVRVVLPRIGEVYDPGAGTGGFLAEAFAFMTGPGKAKIASPDQLEPLRGDMFFGREKENLIHPIALANFVLHGIDQPNLWHGNMLTGQVIYDGLCDTAPELFPRHRPADRRAAPRSRGARVARRNSSGLSRRIRPHPMVQGSDGRDHNPFGFSPWLAGGGARGGVAYGATDDYGNDKVENKVILHDLHAPMLDHERLTYRFGGRDFRLTGVHGRVIREVLA
jgi:hypothetical protein